MKTLKVKGQWASSCLLILLLGLLSLSSLQASSDGIVINKRTDESFYDLQAAIDAAESGDTLQLRGTFVGSFQIDEKSLTLKGKEEEEAILDGNRNGRVLTIVGSANRVYRVILKHLTIQHGLTDAAGAGIFSLAADLTLDHVKVIENATMGNAGGISNALGSLTILHSVIAHNTAANGGAINHSLAPLTIQGSKIKHNQAANFAGGIILISSQNEITDSDISCNEAVQFAGGLLNGSQSETKIKNCKINHNQASFGGGIYNIADLEIADSEINENQCLTLVIEGFSGKGGGIFNNFVEVRGSVILRRSIVKGNKVLLAGGGIFSAGDLIIKKAAVKDNTPNDLVQEES